MNTRNMDDATVERLRAKSDSVDDAVRVLERRRAERDKEIYSANKDGGYSIAEIAEVAGLSKAAAAMAIKIQRALETRTE